MDFKQTNSRSFENLWMCSLCQNTRGKAIKIEIQRRKMCFYWQWRKCNKLYNPITKKVFFSRDVDFNEELSWDWQETRQGTSLAKGIALEEEEEGNTIVNGEIIPSTPQGTTIISPGSTSPSSMASGEVGQRRAKTRSIL